MVKFRKGHRFTVDHHSTLIVLPVKHLERTFLYEDAALQRDTKFIVFASLERVNTYITYDFDSKKICINPNTTLELDTAPLIAHSFLVIRVTRLLWRRVVGSRRNPLHFSI